MSVFTSSTAISEMVLENIVTINQTSLVKNFKMITQCLQHFADFEQKIVNLEKNSTNIMQEIERGKKKQEKDIAEVKSSIKGITASISMGEEYFINPKESGDNEAGKEGRAQGMRNPTIATQIELAESRIKNQFVAELMKMKEEQLQSPIIRRMEREIDELKEKVDQLSKTKVIDSKFFAIEKDIKEMNQSINRNKLEHDHVVTYLDKSIEMINGQFSKIQAKIEEFRLNQIDIDDKIKMKADCSDLFKLEEMLLGIVDHTSNQLVKKMCDKQQTKKALVFLEKRINKVIGLMVGQPGQEEKDALIATKSWKCVSCTKDLGEYEGKLDQYRPWAVFPAKTITKDKYHGFGVGFQQVVQKAVQKKGVQPGYDNYGRMTVPHNLTREVNIGSNKGSVTPITKYRSNSQSHSKIKPTLYQSQSQMQTGTNNLQTNYMNNYGGNYEGQVNVIDEYKKRYKGIGTLIIDSIKEGKK